MGNLLSKLSLPQLAVELPIEDTISYLSKDNWWLEQKLDGKRIVLSPLNGAMINRKGLGCGWYHNYKAYFLGDDSALLDGELVGGTFWVFDFISSRQVPFHERRRWLEENINPRFLIPCAKFVEEKTRLLAGALSDNYEGVIFKNIDALYGDKNALYKVKFKATVDCVVTELNRKGKAAISVSLWDGPDLVEVAGCSVNGKYFPIDIGDVVEVEYLYATESRRLYQPVLLRTRDDKLGSECTIDQLKYSNSKVVIQ